MPETASPHGARFSPCHALANPARVAVPGQPGGNLALESHARCLLRNNNKRTEPETLNKRSSFLELFEHGPDGQTRPEDGFSSQGIRGIDRAGEQPGAQQRQEGVRPPLSIVGPVSLSKPTVAVSAGTD